MFFRTGVNKRSSSRHCQATVKMPTLFGGRSVNNGAPVYGISANCFIGKDLFVEAERDPEMETKLLLLAV